MQKSLAFNVDTENTAQEFFNTNPCNYIWTEDKLFPLLQAEEGNLRSSMYRILYDQIKKYDEICLSCETKYKFNANEPIIKFDLLFHKNKQAILGVEIKSNFTNFTSMWKSELSKYKQKIKNGLTQPSFPVLFIGIWWGEQPSIVGLPSETQFFSSVGAFSTTRCHIIFIHDIRPHVRW